MKIALIMPKNRVDYLAKTILDGLYSLEKEGLLALTKNYTEADLIFLFWGKGDMDFKLAEDIGRWGKTVFIDGSELGKDRRYDKEIQKAVIEGTWVDNGKIDKDMLEKCALYFRRERPYPSGVIPLPYGINSEYVRYQRGIKKDIDFVCIFGQEEFPILRKEVREYLEDYCAKNGFTCYTQRTKNQNEFYNLLARAKVGISVGGGGFDTARFWEILANNCLLLTEKIAIYEEKSGELNYERIKEFSNLPEFEEKLKEVAQFLRKGYNENDLFQEYGEILKRHSSRARVQTILDAAKEKNLI